jgi:hypothetical protein
LHPRHKLDYFKKAGWEEEWIIAAKKIVREEFERSYMAPVIEDDEPSASDQVLVRCFVFSIQFYFNFNFNSDINVELETIQYLLQPSFSCTAQGF